MSPAPTPTDQEQQQLKQMTQSVLLAGFDVERTQATVDALTEKLNIFMQATSDAEAKRSAALTHRNLIQRVNEEAKTLLTKSIDTHELLVSGKGISDFDSANGGVHQETPQVTLLAQKMVLVTELLDRLLTTVVKKQRIEPLIPDDLVGTLTKARSNASNALASTLTAMESCQLANASSHQTQSAMVLEVNRSTKLNQLIGSTAENQTLYDQIQDAYESAVAMQAQALSRQRGVEAQLNEAEEILLDATRQLEMLQQQLTEMTAKMLESTGVNPR